MHGLQFRKSFKCVFHFHEVHTVVVFGNRKKTTFVIICNRPSYTVLLQQIGRAEGQYLKTMGWFPRRTGRTRTPLPSHASGRFRLPMELKYTSTFSLWTSRDILMDLAGWHTTSSRFSTGIPSHLRPWEFIVDVVIERQWHHQQMCCSSHSMLTREFKGKDFTPCTDSFISLRPTPPSHHTLAILPHFHPPQKQVP